MQGNEDARADGDRGAQGEQRFRPHFHLSDIPFADGPSAACLPQPDRAVFAVALFGHRHRARKGASAGVPAAKGSEGVEKAAGRAGQAVAPGHRGRAAGVGWPTARWSWTPRMQPVSRTRFPATRPELPALPIDYARGGVTQLNAEAAPQPAPARILVVEDEPLVRFAIAEALRDLGVSVVEAATADEAWEYLTTGASVDLVFTDHRMPGSMTGAQLAARIRRQYPALKIIITSAHFDAPERPAPVLSMPYNLLKTATDLAEMALMNRPEGTDP
jgi:CheY-like chemotaxis protein